MVNLTPYWTNIVEIFHGQLEKQDWKEGKGINKEVGAICHGES